MNFCGVCPFGFFPPKSSQVWFFKSPPVATSIPEADRPEETAQGLHSPRLSVCSAWPAQAGRPREAGATAASARTLSPGGLGGCFPSLKLRQGLWAYFRGSMVQRGTDKKVLRNYRAKTRKLWAGKRTPRNGSMNVGVPAWQALEGHHGGSFPPPSESSRGPGPETDCTGTAQFSYKYLNCFNQTSRFKT